MKKKDVQKLPKTPGVYLFKKKGMKTPLYVGKATVLSERVKSYFNKDVIDSRGPAIIKMVEEATEIETIPTDSVLEALLLETDLIKKLKPRYNVKERDDKSHNFVVITKEDYPQVLLMRGKALHDEDAGHFQKIYGPFPHSGELREALKIIRKVFPWRDGKCIPGQGKPCFNRQIELCPGVCTREISKREYNFYTRNIKLFLSGKKKEVIANLTKKMGVLSKQKNFEEAAVLRNKIFALKHIHDVALLKREDIRVKKGERVEAYDIAHLSGTDVVGVMVVMKGGSLSKNDYRKFKLKNQKNDDVGNLREILSRRFNHDEWEFPDLIVIDGGKGQINAAKEILKEQKISQIPIVSVVKDKRHKPHRFLGSSYYVKTQKDNIILINQEAHRFAISYHREKRRKKW